MSDKMGSRFTSFFFFTTCMISVLISCSKKDVVQDEPLMTPPAVTDSGQAVPSDSSVGTGTAGAGDTSRGDLSDIFFEFDSYALSSEARNILKGHADWLKANANATIQVEGHCDERGTTEYNLALGERRANAAVDYLLKLGVARTRVSTVSYGEERPLDPGHDDMAWAKNRRAAFVVTSR